MSTARERVQQEAEERFPHPPATEEVVEYPLAALRQFQRGGFIDGRTVTAEQIEQAARALGREDDARHGVYSTDEYRDIARVAFTAAGFIVEEDA